MDRAPFRRTRLILHTYHAPLVKHVSRHIQRDKHVIRVLSTKIQLKLVGVHENRRAHLAMYVLCKIVYGE